MPSMGDVMTVFCRLTCACESAARACVTCAADAFTCASAVRCAISAASRSLFAINWRAASSFARPSFVCASASCTFSRSTSASAPSRFARARSISAWMSDGSRRASTWPFLTIELKSAPSDWIVPDTWLPT